LVNCTNGAVFQNVIGHGLLLYLPWFSPTRPGAIPRCSSVTESNALSTDPEMRHRPNLSPSEERPFSGHGSASSIVRNLESLPLLSLPQILPSENKMIRIFIRPRRSSRRRFFPIHELIGGCGSIWASPPAGRTIPRNRRRVQNTAVRECRRPSSCRCGASARGGCSASPASPHFGEIDRFLARDARCESVSPSASFGVARAATP
jgi:hypothetical protein